MAVESFGVADGVVSLEMTGGVGDGQVMPQVTPWRFLDSVSLRSK